MKRPWSSVGVDDPPALTVRLQLPDEFVDRLAHLAAQLALESLRANQSDPWLDVPSAANYLSCPRSRIYDLVARQRVRVERDGRRLLFRREWLDAALEEGSQ